MTRVKSADFRRKQIVKVAAKLFAERGYEGTTMSDIASKVGILKGSLYYFVKNKQDLAVMAYVDLLDEIEVEMKRIVGSDKNCEERLRDAISGQVHLVLDHLHGAILINLDRGINRFPAKIRKELREKRRAVRYLWIGLIEEGIEKGEFRDCGDAKLSASAILGMCSWIAVWFHKGGTFDVDTIADTFIAIALRGLLKADQK